MKSLKILSEVVIKKLTDNEITKENGQKDKQWSTKHYTETKDWGTRTPLKPRANSGAPDGLW